MSDNFEKVALRLLIDIRELLEIQLGENPEVGTPPKNILKRTKDWFTGKGKPRHPPYHRQQPSSAELAHKLTGEHKHNGS